MGFSDFLQAVGNSNLPMNTQAVVHTGLALKQQQNRDAIMADEKRIRDLQYGEAVKAQEALDRPVDIKTLPQFQALPESVKPQVLDTMIKNKFTDENGVGTMRGLNEGKKFMLNTAEIFNPIKDNYFKDRDKEVLGKLTAWQKAVISKDPNADTLWADYENSHNELRIEKGTFDKHAVHLEAVRAQQAESAAKDARLLKGLEVKAGYAKELEGIKQGNREQRDAVKDKKSESRDFVKGNREFWSTTQKSISDLIKDTATSEQDREILKRALATIPAYQKGDERDIRAGQAPKNQQAVGNWFTANFGPRSGGAAGLQALGQEMFGNKTSPKSDPLGIR